METGDKVLVLLLAKVACCVGLTLAATGALGGFGVWLLDGAGRRLLGAALIGLIVAVVVRRSKRTEVGSLVGDPAHREPRRLKPGQ
jgi:uncharacterized membrane protein